MDTFATSTSGASSTDTENVLEDVFANDMRSRNIGKVEDELKQSETSVSVRGQLRRMKTFITPYEGQRWIHSTSANFFFGGMIIVNAVFIGFETDYNRGKNSFQVNIWLIMESGFLSIFIVELLLRFAADGRVCDSWSVFDMLVVLLGMVDTWVLPAIFDQGVSDMSGITLFRLLRLVRLARVLRILRLLRFIRELLLLVRGIAGALRALGWSFFLMGIVLYVSAVLITEIIRGHFQIKVGDSVRDPDLAAIETWFGSIGASFLTLSQLMTLEGWPTVVRETAMKHNKPWLLGFFLPFICCTNFALLNVVTALMVEKVFEFAQDEKLQDAKKTLKERKKGIHRITKLFSSLDEDGDGMLSLQQVKEAAENPAAMKQFQELGIAKHDIDSLFLCLDVDGKGELTIAEFVEGCLRMAGPATSKDLLRIQYDVHRTMKAVNVKRLFRYVKWSMWCLQTDETQAQGHGASRTPGASSKGDARTGHRGAVCLERKTRRSNTDIPACTGEAEPAEKKPEEDSRRLQTSPSVTVEIPGGSSASSTGQAPGDSEARSPGCPGGVPVDAASLALPPEAEALLEEVLTEQQQTRQLLLLLGREMQALRMRIHCNTSLVQPHLAPDAHEDVGDLKNLGEKVDDARSWCSSNDKALQESGAPRKVQLRVPGSSSRLERRPSGCSGSSGRVERQTSLESMDATVTAVKLSQSLASAASEVRRKKVTISDTRSMSSGSDNASHEGFGIVPGSVVQEGGK